MQADQIKQLHAQFLICWNNQDARGMAALLTDDASMIGFDGSQMNGKTQIETELSAIFSSHQTAPFVWKVQEVRFLNETTALLRAIVGMKAPGKNELNPAVNAIQSLIAISETNDWKIALFQNTPAQFHGRPELVEKITAELSELIR